MAQSTGAAMVKERGRASLQILPNNTVPLYTRRQLRESFSAQIDDGLRAVFLPRVLCTCVETASLFSAGVRKQTSHVRKQASESEGSLKLELRIRILHFSMGPKTGHRI